MKAFVRMEELKYRQEYDAGLYGSDIISFVDRRDMSHETDALVFE